MQRNRKLRVVIEWINKIFWSNTWIVEIKKEWAWEYSLSRCSPAEKWTIGNLRTTEVKVYKACPRKKGYF